MKTKELIRPMPWTWWLHNRYLVLFLIRELTSLFVLGYAVFLIVMVRRYSQGDFHQFFEGVLQCPWAITLQVLALGFVIFHSVTSFNAAPAIMAVRRGEEKVSPVLIVAANYALWIVASAVVFFLAL